MSYIYKVFEHLEQLWMGIWQLTHTVTTTEVSPDLGDLAEILDNVSVEMCYHSYVDKYLSTHFLLLSLHASDDGIVRGYESNIFSSPTARRPLIGFHSSSDSP